mmetsp:Transcript_51828/g.110120  ORF Transcript_51828/g.110120 Transcript_51828/m.110120 type:complete len:217 (+) Transcript_51828:331-981(+)
MKHDNFGGVVDIKSPTFPSSTSIVVGCLPKVCVSIVGAMAEGEAAATSGATATADATDVTMASSWPLPLLLILPANGFISRLLLLLPPLLLLLGFEPPAIGWISATEAEADAEPPDLLILKISPSSLSSSASPSISSKCSMSNTSSWLSTATNRSCIVQGRSFTSCSHSARPCQPTAQTSLSTCSCISLSLACVDLSPLAASQSSADSGGATSSCG